MTSLVQIHCRIRWGRHMRLGGHRNPMARGEARQPIPRPHATSQGESRSRTTTHARAATSHGRHVERGVGGRLGRTSPTSTFMDRCAGCAGGDEARGSGRATAAARVRGARPNRPWESNAGDSGSGEREEVVF
jgi:hypothetical protein